MREVWALLRASWLTARSYRVSLLLSLGGLVLGVIPIYFVSRALQSTMAGKIVGEGGDYFAFLLVGLIAYSLIMMAVSAVPAAIESGIATGTLEALLSTRASVPAILGGLVSYGVLWGAVRGLLVLGAGVLLGAHVAWSHAALSAAILLLTVLAYLAVGLVAAALVLAFRTAGPLARGVLVGSGLLGGVYYPTGVIPSWIQRLSDAVPLTYGLRGIRRTLLEGASFQLVAHDVGVLLLFVAGLMAFGVAAFSWSLRYARRTGTLAQY